MIVNKELGNMIIEAGKFHDLQDGDQRKLMVLESEVLRTRSTNA